MSPCARGEAERRKALYQDDLDQAKLEIHTKNAQYRARAEMIPMANQRAAMGYPIIPPPCPAGITAVTLSPPAGAQKEACVEYSCPNGYVAGCNNSQGETVGSPNSTTCLDGDSIYCYCADGVKNVTLLKNVTLPTANYSGESKELCTMYSCPTGYTAGCYQDDQHIGSPNSDTCYEGDYIDCSCTTGGGTKSISLPTTGAISKQPCTDYSCPNGHTPSCTHNGHAVGSPNSTACQDGDSLSCSSCTSVTSVLLSTLYSGGQIKRPCTTYRCDTNYPDAFEVWCMTAEEGQGVGTINSTTCLDGYYVYCHCMVEYNYEESWQCN